MIGYNVWLASNGGLNKATEDAINQILDQHGIKEAKVLRAKAGEFETFVVVVDSGVFNTLSDNQCHQILIALDSEIVSCDLKG